MKLSMIGDILAIEVPVYIGAIGYLWVSVICMLWATDLFIAAWVRGCPAYHAHNRFLSHRILCFLRKFETWLGMFLFFGDGALYGVLGFIFIGTEDLPLWGFGILIIGAITGSGAYIAWSSEQPQ